MKKVLGILVAVFFSFILVACGDDMKMPSVNEADKVTFAPAEAKEKLSNLTIDQSKVNKIIMEYAVNGVENGKKQKMKYSLKAYQNRNDLITMMTLDMDTSGSVLKGKINTYNYRGTSYTEIDLDNNDANPLIKNGKYKGSASAGVPNFGDLGSGSITEAVLEDQVLNKLIDSKKVEFYQNDKDLRVRVKLNKEDILQIMELSSVISMIPNRNFEANMEYVIVIKDKIVTQMGVVVKTSAKEGTANADVEIRLNMEIIDKMPDFPDFSEFK